eukprot:7390012-Prymnesium_polylepis.1
MPCSLEGACPHHCCPLSCSASPGLRGVPPVGMLPVVRCRTANARPISDYLSASRLGPYIFFNLDLVAGAPSNAPTASTEFRPVSLLSALFPFVVRRTSSYGCAVRLATDFCRAESPRGVP